MQRCANTWEFHVAKCRRLLKKRRFFVGYAAVCCPSAAPPGHKGQPFEQVDILLVLQQRAVQFGQRIGAVACQIFGAQIFGKQQLKPVQNL